MSKNKNNSKFLMKCSHHHLEANEYGLLTFKEGKGERYLVYTS